MTGNSTGFAELQRGITEWLDFERMGTLLEAHPWTFAKTMPQTPHFYTVRKQWADDAAFQWVVGFLRAQGYTSHFYGKPFRQINVNEHFYWTMGQAINLKDGSPWTTIINRRVLSNPSPYDVVAGRYDTLFTGPAYAAENDAAFILALGDLRGKVVLDVGCGDGLALEWRPDLLTEADYTGIDPSHRMLDELVRRFPGVTRGSRSEALHGRVIHTALSGYLPPVDPVSGAVKRFDVVFGMFGVGSYLNDSELARIPLLLTPGGRALLMFYAPGYAPMTHAVLNDRPAFRVYDPGLWAVPHTVQPIGAHLLATYQAP